MEPTLSVATLNIWNCMGPWQERLVSIRSQLSQLNADLIGLQEVLCSQHGEPNQLNSIAEGSGFSTAYAAAWYVGKIGFGNALLSRWPITFSETFELPSVDSDEKRCVLYAEIDSPYELIPVFVTHLNYKLNHGYIREEQVLALAEYVKSKTTALKFPAILMGDFNAAPESNEIRFLKGLCSLRCKSTYFFDAFEIANPREKGNTFTRRNQFTAPMHEPDRRIDYIFVQGPDDWSRGEIINANVCFETPINGVFASDHFGVVAQLRAQRLTHTNVHN